jgi:hypothetical protein|uniref:Uncharacterized protein n=1 Tax=Phage sp. ctKtV17 TaxID=2825792 RepID=A0A8S5UYN3_9VIRU|nr:MAG TPA: hypothetical protein [Phage sp. ctKtV17]
MKIQAGAIAPPFYFETLQVFWAKHVVLYKHRLAKVEKRWTALHE